MITKKISLSLLYLFLIAALIMIFGIAALTALLINSF